MNPPPISLVAPSFDFTPYYRLGGNILACYVIIFGVVVIAKILWRAHNREKLAQKRMEDAPSSFVAREGFTSLEVFESPEDYEKKVREYRGLTGGDVNRPVELMDKEGFPDGWDEQDEELAALAGGEYEYVWVDDEEDE